MANRVNQASLIIRDENFVKPTTVNAKAKKSCKSVIKKGRAGGLGGRKALQDISNKSEISTRKHVKVRPKEEFDIAEEGFLHDHRKCIEEREAALNHFDLNLVLPGYDSITAEDKELKSKAAKKKVDFNSFRCYPEPVELPEPSFADFLKESARPTSPLGYPLKRDAAWIDNEDDFFWEFAEFEVSLKQEIDT